MFYTDDAELKDNSDKTENQQLIFDGTVNLDYADDVPRVKGLIELLSQFYSNKPD